MAVFEKKVQRRSLLDDTDVLTCTVENSQNIQGHTEYIIRIQRGPHPEKCWRVSKRYRDFATLHGLLSISGLSLPLPPKRLIGNMDPHFIAERQVGLQNYLNCIQQNIFLAASLPVRQFLDPDNYSSSLQENALHLVSLALRGEPLWEVLRPLPDVGWRIRKHFFAIKRHGTNQGDQELLLSWTEYGPDMQVEIPLIQSVLSALSTVQIPVAIPIELVRCSEAGCLIVRRVIEKGSLRDILCSCKIRTPLLKKYTSPKQVLPLTGRELVLFSYQILQSLAILHLKGIPYGQLHAGNVCIENGRAILMDIEGGLLGLPSFYRPFIIQHRRLDTIQAIDMYCFGHLLYEMAHGRPLNTSSIESYPGAFPPGLVDLLEQLLSPRALREGLPSAQQMLQHEFFRGLNVEETQSRQIFKLPAQVKEIMKLVASKIEERLRHDQKIVHHQRRLAKVQEMLSSEAEKKRRKQKWKQIEKERHQQQQQQQQQQLQKQVLNGKSPERSDSPASTSTATSAGTMTPPNGVTSVQTVGPTPTPPPPPSGLSSSAVAPERSALLSSISAFNKSALRRVSSPR